MALKSSEYPEWDTPISGHESTYWSVVYHHRRFRAFADAATDSFMKRLRNVPCVLVNKMDNKPYVSFTNTVGPENDIGPFDTVEAAMAAVVTMGENAGEGLAAADE